jgi:hypothetical protein
MRLIFGGAIVLWSVVWLLATVADDKEASRHAIVMCLLSLILFRQDEPS